MITIGDQVPDAEVLDEHGNVVRLADLWARRPVALFFLRHLGWPFCREHVVDVRQDYERFRAAGGDVVVITMGTPAQVAAFRQRLELPFPCLSDQRQQAYRALGVPKGKLAQVAGPSIWASGLRALVRGGLGLPRGDLYQLHGAFVVDAGGVLRFVHRPRNSSDYPDHEAMLAAMHA